MRCESERRPRTANSNLEPISWLLFEPKTNRPSAPLKEHREPPSKQNLRSSTAPNRLGGNGIIELFLR